MRVLNNVFQRVILSVSEKSSEAFIAALRAYLSAIATLKRCRRGFLVSLGMTRCYSTVSMI